MFTCFEEVDKVFQAIQVAHFPNLNRVAERLSQGQSAVQHQLAQYGSSCVKPVFDYFLAKFQHDLKPAVNALKQPVSFGPTKSMI